MREEQIRKYATLMQELGLSGIEITEGKEQIRLERNVSQTVSPVVLPVSQEAAAPVPQAGVVTSPMVGIYYEAPAENAAPYVRPGDRVQKGQTLCIIEAMKLLSEIPAEYDGIVREVCASNGQTVEYGTKLFHIERL